MINIIKSIGCRNLLYSALLLGISASLVACSDDDNDPKEPIAQLSAEEKCSAFLNKDYGEATVTKVTFVTASDDLPEHCVVLGEMPEDLDFEVHMPSDWNGRTVFMGGGGFDGSIYKPDQNTIFSPDILKRGYATIASNHGHNQQNFPDQSWALNEQMLKDYAYQSVPRVMPPASEVLKEQYGESWESTKTVFEGCSGGGRQALIQAQRHPNLFDGIITRAPANDFNAQFLWYHKVLNQLAQPGAGLTDVKIQTIRNAMLAKCDANDGLEDGILGNPQSCDFDPAELACTGAENDSCLTDPQIQSVRTFLEPTDIANGRYTWPGFLLGSQFRNAPWLEWADDGTGKRQMGIAHWLMDGYIRFMVAQDASIDPLELDPTQYTDRIDELVNLIDATDPDLSEFKSLGGKLILWTGLTDSVITAKNATAYFEDVIQEMGGEETVQEFMEYYTSPGVTHCNGGEGADKVDLIGPMFEWLENDVPPSQTQIVATQWSPSEGEPTKNRPLCQYPKYPRYIEGGDPSAAASFECVLPE